MTPAEHLALLGPEVMAEIERRVAAAPPPPPSAIAELRPVLAPAMQRVRARRLAEQKPRLAA